MSSIFQVMPLYTWIIIACVIIVAVVILIKLKFFGKTALQREHEALDKKYSDTFEESSGLFDSFAKRNGGKRKSKNMKKRRKYKK